jgi:hypothetical protein
MTELIKYWIVVTVCLGSIWYLAKIALGAVREARSEINQLRKDTKVIWNQNSDMKETICQCDKNGRVPECECSEKLLALNGINTVVSKGEDPFFWGYKPQSDKYTPLSDRDPIKATSMKKLYSKIKWDKLTGKEG